MAVPSRRNAAKGRALRTYFQEIHKRAKNQSLDNKEESIEERRSREEYILSTLKNNKKNEE